LGTYKIILAAMTAAIVTIGVVVGVSLSKGTFASQQYEISVDPFKDPQSLFTMARVTIQNVGSEPLTNVRANFGAGQIQELGTLKPGQKIIVSPPSDNPMEFVIVTANEGIYVNKVYRIPSKMPGMMGS
jgi:hypothetical protein